MKGSGFYGKGNQSPAKHTVMLATDPPKYEQHSHGKDGKATFTGKLPRNKSENHTGGRRLPSKDEVRKWMKKQDRETKQKFLRDAPKLSDGPANQDVSPAKQEGPQTKKNVDLMKGEMEGTWVDKSTDKASRIIDYEERASFLNENDIPDLEGSKDPKDIARLKQLKKTAKNLQHEADIIRNRKTK